MFIPHKITKVSESEKVIYNLTAGWNIAGTGRARCLMLE